jgi:hypothetical protein
MSLSLVMIKKSKKEEMFSEYYEASIGPLKFEIQKRTDLPVSEHPVRVTMYLHNTDYIDICFCRNIKEAQCFLDNMLIKIGKQYEKVKGE